jgi:hypothetical protein
MSMRSSKSRTFLMSSLSALTLLAGAALAPSCSSGGGKSVNQGTGGDGDTGGSGDTGGATPTGGKMATGGATGDTGGSMGNTGGSMGNTGGSIGDTGGSMGNTGGSMGNTGGSMGNTGGSMGNTGGSGGAVSSDYPPCTDPPDMNPPALKRGAMVTGFMGQAGQVIGAPDDPTIMYVISHTTGNVYVVKDLKVQPQPLLNVSVAGNGNGPEQGLLGIAMHPQFKTNHLMYVLYTASGGGQITVDEFERMTPTMAMFKQNIHKHAGSNMYHNGGSIYFNPKDDKPLLYHSVGNAQQPPNSANPTAMNGKVLRYDITTKMGVPAMGGQSFTFAYGLRNPYRMSVDRLTGDIWIGDVADGPGGAIFFMPHDSMVQNFGYGTGGEVKGGISGFQAGNAAIIGGVVYRGSKIKGMCGRYFFGMHANGAIMSMIQMNGQRVGAVASHGPLAVPGQLSSFGEDTEGEIWMSSRMNNAIYKIEAM